MHPNDKMLQSFPFFLGSVIEKMLGDIFLSVNEMEDILMHCFISLSLFQIWTFGISGAGVLLRTI